MNKILQHFIIDVEFPDVSGAEHLEMLQLRDKLFEIETTLSAAEKEALAAADRRLVERSGEFYAELARFINFEQRRQTQRIAVARWWWYLDVLAQLPQSLSSQKQELVTA
jgi:hypothetical protein